ncbi:ABC transporter permease [Paenibacillus sp. QZ-Y1]|uniref:ABC transporter permease n=1 Tax=Paenibacillus sp. QZ-Y1 TaxID=3414511 RepID=UPI003F78B5FB
MKYKLLGLNSFTVSFGMFLATLVFQIIATLLLIIFAVTTKGVSIPYDNIISVILMVMLINLYQFSIVILLTALVDKSTTYQSIALIIFYIQIFLGGLTFPPEMFPQVVRNIVYVFNPIIYGLEAMRGIWTDGHSIFVYAKEFLILLLVSTFLISIGLLLAKKREKIQYQ